MGRALMYLLELIGVGGIVGLMAFIPWTKMALGGALTFLGAFFPSLKDERQATTGDGQLTWQKIILKFRGGIRFGVVMGGVVLLVGAVLEGHEGFTKKKEIEEAARAQARAELYEKLRERIDAKRAAQLKEQSASNAADDALISDILLDQLSKQKKAAP